MCRAPTRSSRAVETVVLPEPVPPATPIVTGLSGGSETKTHLARLCTALTKTNTHDYNVGVGREPPLGLEPKTSRLRSECSAIELRWQSVTVGRIIALRGQIVKGDCPVGRAACQATRRGAPQRGNPKSSYRLPASAGGS